MRKIRVLLAAVAIFAAAAQEKPADQAQFPPPLTAEQKQALQDALKKAADETKASVEPLAQKLAVVAKDIDLNLLSDKPDTALDRKLSNELSDTVAQTVRSAMDLRLKSVRAIVSVLTPEQKKMLRDELQKPGADPDLTELVGKIYGLKK